MTTPQPDPIHEAINQALASSFEYEEDTFRLVFEDPKYAGLEVEARELPFGKTMTLMGLVGEGGIAVSRAPELLAAFGEALVSWNLTKGGAPVPCTAEGLESLSVKFVLPMVMAWYQAQLGVGDPLSAASSDGVTPGLEASIPTETLSPSPQS